MPEDRSVLVGELGPDRRSQPAETSPNRFITVQVHGIECLPATVEGTGSPMSSRCLECLRSQPRAERGRV